MLCIVHVAEKDMGIDVFCHCSGLVLPNIFVLATRGRLIEYVSSRDSLAPCSPSRLSLGTALVRRDCITKDTSVCRLICVAIWHPYLTTNEVEVWALQRTKKPAGLRLSVLTIKFN